MSTCTTSESYRPNQAAIKVIGLGLNRTGTLSLCYALEKLGFGPCYHTFNVPSDKVNWIPWAKVLDGQNDPEYLDTLLQGYGSALDSPVALAAEAIYKAYPDAKYILTTRDPDAWEKSVKATFVDPLFKYAPAILREQAGQATEEDRQFMTTFPWSAEQRIWGEARSNARYNGRFPYENPRLALFEHDKWIKETIPAEKLLIFDVKEGWGPLAKFLGVPEPSEPFPRVNETTAYWDYLKKSQ